MKLTEPQRRALRDLFLYRGRHLGVWHRHQTLQALVARGLANSDGRGHGHTISDQGVRWAVENDGATAPADLVEEAHAEALRENAERTPAPVVTTAKLTPFGEQMQEQVRAAERAAADSYLDRVRDIRAQHRREDAARFEAALREGMVAVVRTMEALAPALLAFARNASAAAAGLAEAFGVPHPNACALCGQGEGPRDHWGSSHDYRPPVDVIRLRRMQLRRTAGYPARERVHAAHVKYRRAVNLRALYEHLEREAPWWTEGRELTELERAGLTETPFDQQGGNPDEWKQGEKHGNVAPSASAYSLPS